MKIPYLITKYKKKVVDKIKLQKHAAWRAMIPAAQLDQV